MPIYEYECDKCKTNITVMQQIGSDAPECPKCGVGMSKKPTHPAMVKMKGEGGYPSRQKEWKRTAPYSGGR